MLAQFCPSWMSLFRYQVWLLPQHERQCLDGDNGSYLLNRKPTSKWNYQKFYVVNWRLAWCSWILPASMCCSVERIPSKICPYVQEDLPLAFLAYASIPHCYMHCLRMNNERPSESLHWVPIPALAKFFVLLYCASDQDLLCGIDSHQQKLCWDGSSTASCIQDRWALLKQRS